MLYTCTNFYQSISNAFRATDPNTRVDARVVANVDRRTYGRAIERIIGSLYKSQKNSKAVKKFVSVCCKFGGHSTLFAKF